jgi:hypothetical protein
MFPPTRVSVAKLVALGIRTHNARKRSRGRAARHACAALWCLHAFHGERAGAGLGRSTGRPRCVKIFSITVRSSIGRPGPPEFTPSHTVSQSIKFSRCTG